MPPLGHRRQLVLFVAAIVVPCVAVAVLSLRLIRQDRELVGKRALDQRRETLNRAREDLVARLETIRSEALRTGAPSAAVALVASVRGGQLVLPWEEDPDVARLRRWLGQADVERRMHDAERQEFAAGNPRAAAEIYNTLARAARDSAEGDYARLLAARALAKAHRTREARQAFEAVLAARRRAVDEEGVPLSIVAADGFLDCGGDATRALAVVRVAAAGDRWVSPAARYAALQAAEKLIRMVATPEQGEQARALREMITGQARTVAQAQSMQNDFERLRIPASSSRGGPVWVLYGDDPWLAGLSQPAQGGETRLVAVRAAEVFRAAGAEHGVRFYPVQHPEGDLLGEQLAGVKAMPDTAGDDSTAGRHRSQYLVWAASMLLLLTATGFGAYLLWRDMSREMRLAGLRSQFVSNVTHELKTPLTAIRMFAETLQMGRPKDPAVESEYLDTIVSECERLTRLVDGVLEFSRMEQGKKTYRFQPVRPAEAVRAAARTLEYPLKQRGFRLEMNIDDAVPSICADQDALEQAVLNLLTNAMKYSGERKDVRVELRRCGDESVISVTDQGNGIAPAEQARIFEKFYRVPSPENRSIPGTGLGLTLVSQIVKAHGGRVQVESAPGKGSTFSIRLPLEGRHERHSGN